MLKAKALIGLGFVLIAAILLLAIDAVDVGAADRPPGPTVQVGSDRPAQDPAQIAPSLVGAPLGLIATYPSDLASPAAIPITDDLIITQSVTLQPGVYNIEDVNEDGLIIIAGDDITLDGSGVYINGLDFGGYGIVMDGHTGLTLRNFDIQGFRYGVRMQNAQDMLIEDSNLSGNHKDTTSGWLDINVSWGYYGGGILFEDVYSSMVRNNTLTHQSTGVELFYSHYNTIVSNTISSGPEGNETGQNSCWGVRLYASMHNLIEDNQADYVDRERYGLSSGDSAGMLLVYGSHENQVIGNSFTHSGDGFFIGNEWGAPSNDNYIYGNDGSYSPHNAFETTFSDGNLFEDNLANYSHFGFWLGYSYNTRVTGNEIVGNLGDGIAIEHGHDNELDHNQIAGSQAGIRLWDDGGPANPSTGYHIHDNTIRQNATGVVIYDTDAVSMTLNLIEDNANIGVFLDAASVDVALAYNHLAGQGAQAVTRSAARAPGPDPDDMEPRARARPGRPPMAPGYSVYNNMGSGYDVWATWNWWGTTSPEEIEALIFDHLDDASKGIVWYDPFLTEPIWCTGLLVLPDELAATVPQGAATVAALQLRNCTTVPLTYTLTTEPADWLAADAPGGVLAAGQVQTATFGLDAGDLAVGFYTGTVTIDHTAPGSPEIVPASLLVVGGGCGPLLGPWLETTPLPQPAAAPFENQHGQQLVFYGDYVYVFGGRNAGEWRLTEVYYSTIQADGSLGAWTETTSLPGLYYDHVTVHVGDHVYLLTGAAGSTAVWYAPLNPDGSLGAWAGTAPFDVSRQNFAAVAYGSHIYASGGNAMGTRDFVQFTAVNPDGTLDPWAYTTSLPEPIEGHTMVAHDGYLYVMARSGTVYYAAIQPGGGVGNWSTTAPMPGPMYGHASFVYSRYLYLLDGQSPAAYYALILDDHSLSPWQVTTWRPAVRQATRAGAQGCHAYGVGGFDGTFYHDTVYYADLQTLLSGVEIAGPALGLVEMSYTFTATASPPTATQPIYFDWQATGQPTITTSNGTTATVTLAWTTPGTQTLTVTAYNVASPVRDDHPIRIYGPLEADFSATPRLGMPPLAVIFTDLSAGYLTAWAWDFGDGGSSDVRHPTHTYEVTGTFTVTLTITGMGGSDTVVKPDYIRVSRAVIYLPLVLRNY